MEMNKPVGNNAIDDNINGLIGKPLDRVDGPLKVCGKAMYAYEYNDKQPAAFGFITQASIAKGRISSIDTDAAEKAPGVLLVMSFRNAQKQGSYKERGANPQFVDDKISHFGQPVALVVAQTFEQARSAAALVKVNYKEVKGKFDLDHNAMTDAKKPKGQQQPPDSSVGNFKEAFEAAPVRFDATYTTPNQCHAMMEPHATLAVWNSDRLTVYTSNQIPSKTQKSLAETLKISEENVRIVSRYVGGGFGGKLWMMAEATLAALAARELKRPVKLALTRPQVFHVTTHRPATVQRIRLGASSDGKLTAIAHESWSGDMPGMGFYETAADQTRSLYAAPDRMTSHRLAELDLPKADSMRAPGEAVGLLAIEQAMDELAHQLNIDPIELRIMNEPAEDPEKKIPFSTRNLVGCMQEGARQFGWDKRNPKPMQVRDGPWLVGMGMAAAIRGNMLSEAKCYVRFDPDSTLTVQMASTDIGTGTYTILTQIAAEMLGLPPESVKVLIGDSAFPPTQGSGGSWAAGSQGSALFDACSHLRDQFIKAAGIDTPGAAIFKNSMVSSGDAAGVKLTDLLKGKSIEATGELKPGDMAKKYSQFSYGAHFAEVGVDIDTGEIRLRRMQSFYDGGRILNAKTARSQAIGGMTFGLGAALMEDSIVDKRYGFFVNHDLAEYHIPTHADVPAIDAVYLPGVDDKSNALKSKGLGELGISGSGAAIANAVFNATGVRIRNYPLTLDKVVKGWA
jgi:xanthine dehydrogenase YagR molybdenum-binding subunit